MQAHSEILLFFQHWLIIKNIFDLSYWYLIALWLIKVNSQTQVTKTSMTIMELGFIIGLTFSEIVYIAGDMKF